jgi:deoxyadenosine/deoxycytidine kinase
MYKDPHRWSFAFQSYEHATMLNCDLKPSGLPIIFKERSIYSGWYCFLECAKQLGHMNQTEYCLNEENV